jgi:hypothetical protein
METNRASGIFPDHRWQAFAENTLAALRIVTKESSGQKFKLDGAPLPGKIGNTPRISAMDAS